MRQANRVEFPEKERLDLIRIQSWDNHRKGDPRFNVFIDRILGSVQHLTQDLTLRGGSLEREDGKKATSIKDGNDVSRDGARKRA